LKKPVENCRANKQLDSRYTMQKYHRRKLLLIFGHVESKRLNLRQYPFLQWSFAMLFTVVWSASDLSQ